MWKKILTARVGHNKRSALRRIQSSPAGKFDDAMQVIGHNHPAVDEERMRAPCIAHAGPQRVDVFRQKRATAPSQRIDREEIRPAGVPGASIVGHGVAWQEYGAMRCAYCALRGLRSFIAQHLLERWVGVQLGTCTQVGHAQDRLFPISLRGCIARTNRPPVFRDSSGW